MDGAMSHWKCADKWDIRQPSFWQIVRLHPEKRYAFDTAPMRRGENQTKLTAQLRETKYESLKSGAKKMLTASAVVS